MTGFTGGDGNDSLYGGSGYCTIDGGAGLDLIEGGDANDYLIFTVGEGGGYYGSEWRFDSYDGRRGTDILQINLTGAQVAVYGQAVTDLIQAINAAAAPGIDGPYISSELLNLRVHNLEEVRVVVDGAQTTLPFATSGNDTLLGTTSADNFDGLGGNDSITGGSGNDTIRGGDGNDTLQGDSGNDIVYGGAGNDRLVLGSGNDLVHGGNGDDVLVATWGDNFGGGDTISGTDGVAGAPGSLDRIQIQNAGIYDFTGTNVSFFDRIDIVTEDRGGMSVILTDAVAATADANGDGIYGDLAVVGYVSAILANPGSTTGAVHLDGSNLAAGRSLHVYGQNGSGQPSESQFGGLAGNDTLVGGAGGDMLNGGLGTDSLVGNNGTDTLIGDAGNDRLYGGAGDDTLNAGQGNDVVDGGEGSDRAIYLGNRGHYALVRLENGSIRIVDNDTLTGGDEGTDTLTGVEFIQFADQLFDVATLPLGTSGNDSLVGTSVADGLFGGDGNDTIVGGGGGDTVDGGAGDDLVRLGLNAGSVILGDVSGDDTLEIDGPSVLGIFAADPEGDGFRLVGGGQVHFDDDGKPDVLRVVTTGDGTREWAFYAPLPEFDPGPPDGGGGSASMAGRSLPPAPDNTDLWWVGDFENNIVTGSNGGDDLLFGGAGNDCLNGAAGDDILSGGRGDDTLIGGAGQDTVLFWGNRADYTIAAISGGMRITFNGVGPGPGGSGDGIDDLYGIEYLRFADQTVTALPAVSVAGTPSVAEGTGPGGARALVFTVSLDQASSGPVTVAFATSGGTATADADYVGRSGTLTFAAGETTKTVTVWTLPDPQVEADETLTLVLSSPSGATLGNAVATGTITNDDANATAVATAANGSVGVGRPAAAVALFAWTDGNGDPATQFEFRDDSAGGTSGYFTVGGVAQAAGTAFTVAAGNLASVNFVGGALGQSDQLQVRVHDGTAWGAWRGWTMTTVNTAPVVAAPDVALSKGLARAASDFFTVNDAQGDTITQYRFWDGSAGAQTATVRIDGVVQAANQNIQVAAADLHRVTIQGGTAVTGEPMWVQVFDGTVWSAWTEWTMAQANTAPVATAVAANVYLVQGAVLSASALLNWTDANGDAAASYRFWDDRGVETTSAIALNGVTQGHGAWIQVTAANLGTVTLHAGSYDGVFNPVEQNNTFWVAVSDGFAWSNSAQFNARTVLSSANVTGGAGADLLVGNDGANWLNGAAGNDTLVGGGDQDWFVVGHGHDVIADFADDIVDVTAVAGLDSFAALMAMAVQDGAHTVFNFGGGNGLTLRNVDKDDLLEGDFVI